MPLYELGVIIDPEIPPEEETSTLERLEGIITDAGGEMVERDTWGRRQLAFPIAKLHKAHYVLMNIECGAETLAELESAFRFNDAVLRHLTIKCKEAITAPSPLVKQEEKDDSGEKAA